jgi:hypothetical protein
MFYENTMQREVTKISIIFYIYLSFGERYAFTFGESFAVQIVAP